MSKTIDVHELSQRILAYLEELSGENIYTIINSIIEPSGDIREVAIFRCALSDLTDKDEITITMRPFAATVAKNIEKVDALNLIAGLQEWFRFDVADPHWTLAEGDIRAKPLPEVHITDKGQRKAVEILTARGVEWWRQRLR